MWDLVWVALDAAASCDEPLWHQVCPDVLVVFLCLTGHCLCAFALPLSRAVLSCAQFADIAHFQVIHTQSLFESSWPAGTISEASTAGGLTGSTWNYGSNFGGTSSTWTSGASTVHGGEASGMFGSFGMEDGNYGPALCPGTAGSVCLG